MKNIQLQLLIITILITGGKSIAQAQGARKYTNSACAEIQKTIKIPSGSAGFYLDTDCSTAYVLPPVQGKIVPSSFTAFVGYDAALCSGLNDRISQLSQNTPQLESFRKQLIQNQNESLKNDSLCKQEEQDDAEALQELQGQQKNYDQMVKDLTSIKSQRLGCHEQECVSLDQQQTNIETQISILNTILPLKQQSYNQVHVETLACQGERDSIKTTLAATTTDLQKFITDISQKNQTLQTAILADYERMKTIPAALFTGSFQMGQVEMVEKFKSLNSDSKTINFAAMPINEAFLSFTSANDIRKGYPMLTSLEIPGVVVNTSSEISTVPMTLDTTSNSVKNVSFGAALGAQAEFNQFATCQLLKEAGSRQNVPLNRIAKMINVNSTYKYQLAVSRNINIKYNQSELYCLIKNQSKSNGLFSSSSSSSVTENSSLNQWLKLDVYSEDQNFDFADRDTLLLDLRKQVLDQELAKIARGYLTKEQAQLIAPNEPGAAAISSNLKKCSNLYCQFGGVLLDLGSALFGGSSSSSSTCSNVGSSTNQTLTDTKAVPAFGTQSFQVESR